MNAGDLLQPDDVTFSVLMRGYGEMKPPSWLLISGLLKMMEKQFQMKPSLGMPAAFRSAATSRSVPYLHLHVPGKPLPT